MGTPLQSEQPADRITGITFLEFDEVSAPTPVSGKAYIYFTTANVCHIITGDGVDHIVSIGATNIKGLWLTPMEDSTGTVGNWEIVSINASQDCHFSFKVPHDFETLSEAVVVVIPDATETIQFDLNVSTSASDVAQDDDAREALNGTKSVIQDTIEEIDVSGVLGTLVAGEYVTLAFHSDTANIRVWGFNFDYT